MIHQKNPGLENPFMNENNSIIQQEWDRYNASEHKIWTTLFKRQIKTLKNHAVAEYFHGLETIGLESEFIPNFDRLNERLYSKTRWEIVAVPGLVDESLFFNLLACRRFPATRWIRRPEQMDFLQEPDIFHDVFGHVPLLVIPAFADYMQAYGAIAKQALDLFGTDIMARLYWYTVEFGLVQTHQGLQIYGAGIVSSKSESVYCLESHEPKRIYFDLARILNTQYIIDHFQKIYFVIKNFHELLKLIEVDWIPYLKSLDIKHPIPAGAVLSNDHFYGVQNIFK